MKKLNIIFLLLTTQFAFASHPTGTSKPTNVVESQITSTIQEKIGLENTCTDEYMIRRKFIRKKLIYTPIAGTVATPIVGGASGLAVGYGVSLVGITGWSGLGYLILGAYAAGAAVIGTTLYKEGKYIFKSISVNRMLNLISESHNKMSRGYISNKYHRMYKSWYADDRNITLSEFQDIIIDLDQSGALCDGTVTNRLTSKYLSSRLTLRNSLLKYIHNYRLAL